MRFRVSLWLNGLYLKDCHMSFYISRVMFRVYLVETVLGFNVGDVGQCWNEP